MCKHDNALQAEDAHSCRCPGRFFAEAEVALVAMILLSKCTPLPAGALSQERFLRQGAEVLAGSSACHQLESRAALQSAETGLHDSTSSAAAMQHSAGCKSSLHQVCRPPSHATDAYTGEEECTYLPGETGASAAGVPPVILDGPTSRYERGVHKPFCRQGLCKHQEVHIALPLPELRRQVGIRWPQQDLSVTLT